MLHMRLYKVFTAFCLIDTKGSYCLYPDQWTTASRHRQHPLTSGVLSTTVQWLPSSPFSSISNHGKVDAPGHIFLFLFFGICIHVSGSHTSVSMHIGVWRPKTKDRCFFRLLALFTEAGSPTKLISL